MPIPILEVLTSTFRRLMTGLSPMKADRGHFHHRMLDAGFSVKSIFILYLGVSSASAATGLLLWDLGYSESVLFYAFLALSAVWLAAMVKARQLASKLPKFLRRGELRRLLWGARRAEPSSGP